MKKIDNTRLVWFKRVNYRISRHLEDEDILVLGSCSNRWETQKLKTRSIHLIRTDSNALFYSWVLLYCVYEHNFHSSAEGHLGCCHEPRAYCTEWSKSERERQIQHISAYIRNLEGWYGRSYMQGSTGDTGIKNRHLDSVGGEGGMIWENSISAFILPYVK